MFESAELGHRIDKHDYKRELPALRESLLRSQLELAERADFAVVLLVGGVDGAGKGDVVNRLLEWMDAREIEVHAMGSRTDEERARPPMWRFWRVLPPRGKTAIFFDSWHSELITERAEKRTGDAEWTRSLQEIVRFERMLVDEGTLVVKLWLHLTKKAQRRRFEELESRPDTAWRVTRADWERHARYHRHRRVADEALRETSTAEAPWAVIEATDPRYRDLAVGRALRDALRGRLDRAHRARPAPPRDVPPVAPPVDARDVVAAVDLSKALGERAYERKLPKLQARLNELSRDKRFRERSLVVVFEGNDAAGKGGAIRRITAGLDARYYRVISTAAPKEEERARPYLWRFWRHVPRRGHVALFDRSWYGRVLVERVEGLAPVAAWTRAYREIVDFEEELIGFGAVLVKFWLAVSKEVQLARFRERRKTPFKRYKLTPEDWRNRGRWALYDRAVCDMVDRTSTDLAPWHLVPADDKRWARIEVMETLCDTLERELR